MCCGMQLRGNIQSVPDELQVKREIVNVDVNEGLPQGERIRETCEEVAEYNGVPSVKEFRPSAQRVPDPEHPYIEPADRVSPVVVIRRLGVEGYRHVPYRCLVLLPLQPV